VKIKINTFILCILFLITHTNGLPSPEEWKLSSAGQFSTLSKEEVDSFISPLITYNLSRGIVVVLVDRNGYVWYSYGGSDPRTGIPVDNTTLFDIGSISKTMTGILIADSDLNDKFTLSTPINSWFGGDYNLPGDGANEITGIDLVTHQSGLPRTPEKFSEVNPADSEADQIEESMQHFQTMTADDTYREISNSTLLAPPGYQYLYSNLGGAIAGDVVARAENKSYSDLFTDKIVRTLKMTSTGSSWSLDDLNRRATGYRGYAYPIDEAHLIRFNEFWASSGGIHSDADDMTLFLGAELGLFDSPLSHAILKTQTPLSVASDGPPLLEQGIFLDILHNRDGTIIMKKAGETNAHQADIAWNPSLKSGVVILSDTAHIGGIHVEDTAIALLEKMQVTGMNQKI
jgi:serine-type D-Ala-D-Ala carboxypeptidase/endopeptidase